MHFYSLVFNNKPVHLFFRLVIWFLSKCIKFILQWRKELQIELEAEEKERQKKLEAQQKEEEERQREIAELKAGKFKKKPKKSETESGETTENKAGTLGERPSVEGEGGSENKTTEE